MALRQQALSIITLALSLLSNGPASSKSELDNFLTQKGIQQPVYSLTSCNDIVQMQVCTGTNQQMSAFMSMPLLVEVASVERILHSMQTPSTVETQASDVACSSSCHACYSNIGSKWGHVSGDGDEFLCVICLVSSSTQVCSVCPALKNIPKSSVHFQMVCEGWVIWLIPNIAYSSSSAQFFCFSGRTCSISQWHCLAATSSAHDAH